MRYTLPIHDNASLISLAATFVDGRRRRTTPDRSQDAEEAPMERQSNILGLPSSQILASFAADVSRLRLTTRAATQSATQTALSENEELVLSMMLDKLHDTEDSFDTLVRSYAKRSHSLEAQEEAFNHKRKIFLSLQEELDQKREAFELQQKEFEAERAAFQEVQWEAAKLQGSVERTLEKKEQSLNDLEEHLLEATKEYFKTEAALQEREAAVERRLEAIHEALERLTQQKVAAERLERLTLAHQIQEYLGKATAEDVFIMLNWTLSQPAVKNVSPKATLDAVFQHVIQPHLLSGDLRSSEALRDALIEPMVGQVNGRGFSLRGTPLQG